MDRFFLWCAAELGGVIRSLDVLVEFMRCSAKLGGVIRS